MGNLRINSIAMPSAKKIDAELRWEELKKRLLEDEQIRSLDQESRSREIERRWLELKARSGI